MQSPNMVRKAPVTCPQQTRRPLSVATTVVASFLFSLMCVSPVRADSADNVNSAIRILASIPAIEDRIEARGRATSSDIAEIISRYEAALEVGSDYWSWQLRRQFGRSFANEWSDAIAALEEIVDYYSIYSSLRAGETMSERRIIKMMGAMGDLEDFRLFYERWRMQ